MVHLPVSARATPGPGSAPRAEKSPWSRICVAADTKAFTLPGQRAHADSLRTGVHDLGHRQSGRARTFTGFAASQTTRISIVSSPGA